MSTIKSTLLALYRDEKGLTTVEYAIAGGLIGAVVITAFTSLGSTVVSKITGIVTSLGGGS